MSPRARVVERFVVGNSMRRTHQARKMMQMTADWMAVVVLMLKVRMKTSEAVSCWNRWLCLVAVVFRRVSKKADWVAVH